MPISRYFRNNSRGHGGPTKRFHSFRAVEVVEPTGIVSLREFPNGKKEMRHLVRRGEFFNVEDVVGQSSDGVVEMKIASRENDNRFRSCMKMIAFEYALQDRGFSLPGYYEC